LSRGPTPQFPVPRGLAEVATAAKYRSQFTNTSELRLCALLSDVTREVRFERVHREGAMVH
jgi:hypothetical protein